MSDRDGAPAILIGIDTEADDQWSVEGRRRMEVRNAEHLPALQALFEEFGARPTYLTTWEMATTPGSASILKNLLRSGRCEIGTHLHPWSSPPFRPEDVTAHTYPFQLPVDLLERQMRELTETIASEIGIRPVSYKAGRCGLDGRALPILEELGYLDDNSIDPLFNERRKGGMSFAGAPHEPYHPDYSDVRRKGRSKILEIPITSAMIPALPRALETLYTMIPALPYRGAMKRLGLRPAWLRPSYSPVPDMLTIATRLRKAGFPYFNVTFHSSEILPGGSPYNPDATSVTRFLDELRRLLEHLTVQLGAAGRTYAEFTREWTARE